MKFRRYAQLQGEFTRQYVPKSMRFTKGNKTIDFKKMTYSQLAEELAGFYLDDEATGWERKRKIEREFERNQVRSY